MEDFSFTFKFLSTLPTINSPTIKANKNSVTDAQERLHLQDCECSVCEIHAGRLLHIQMLKETATAMSFDCEFTTYAFITEQ